MISAQSLSSFVPFISWVPQKLCWRIVRYGCVSELNSTHSKPIDFHLRYLLVGQQEKLQRGGKQVTGDSMGKRRSFAHKDLTDPQMDFWTITEDTNWLTLIWRERWLDTGDKDIHVVLPPTHLLNCSQQNMDRKSMLTEQATNLTWTSQNICDSWLFLSTGLCIFFFEQTFPCWTSLWPTCNGCS